MSLSLAIYYKDTTRKPLFAPVSFQSVLHDYWWPLANKLELQHIAMFEVLVIREAEELIQLLDELKTLKEYLQNTSEVSQDTVDYMLMRIGELTSYLQQALQEWDQVAKISI